MQELVEQKIRISTPEKSIYAHIYAHIWVCHVWHPNMQINAVTTWSRVSAYSLSLVLKSLKRSKHKCSQFAVGADIPHKSQTQQSLLAVCLWYENLVKGQKRKCLQLAVCTQILLVDQHYQCHWLIMIINQENLGTKGKLWALTFWHFSWFFAPWANCKHLCFALVGDVNTKSKLWALDNVFWPFLRF